jgi:hypothetical protein
LPFKALLAGWSLVIAVLSVAGYSFRWTYYYNFGLPSLVLTAPLASLPVYAIEIIRNPDNLAHLVKLIVLYLLPLNLALLALKRARNFQHTTLRAGARFVIRLLALENPFVVESMTATLLLFIAFHVGGEAGYRAYLNNALESTSKLPRATLISMTGSPELPQSIACDTRALKDRGVTVTPPLIGDPMEAVRLGGGAACSNDNRSWRLLLRDDKFIYLFATVRTVGERPETLVLPNSDKTTLVLR